MLLNVTLPYHSFTLVYILGFTICVQLIVNKCINHDPIVTYVHITQYIQLEIFSTTILL